MTGSEQTGPTRAASNSLLRRGGHPSRSLGQVTYGLRGAGLRDNILRRSRNQLGPSGVVKSIETEPRWGHHPADNGNEFKRKQQEGLLWLDGICWS
jgi:hypothetical protein